MCASADPSITVYGFLASIFSRLLIIFRFFGVTINAELP